MEGSLLSRHPPPEEETLIRCLRSAGTSRSPESPPVAALDGSRLASLATRHGVLPLLYRRAREWPDLPSPVRLRLRGLFRENLRRNLLLTARLVKTLDLLDRNHIPSISFKGPVLALATGRDLASRQFVDLDILVRKDDARRARDILLSRGYRPERTLRPEAETVQLRSQCDYKLFGPNVGEAVEIHWDFVPRHCSVSLDLEGAWERSTSLDIAGRQVRVLGDEDRLLMLAVHGAKHLWERLAWIHDLASLIAHRSDLDWAWILHEARRRGIARILSTALLLAEGFTGRHLPAPAARAVRSDHVARELARGLAASLLPRAGAPVSTLAAARLHLRVRERPADRLRLATRLALTTTQRDWSTFPLPGRFFGLCGLWRPFRLLGDLGRSLLAAAPPPAARPRG